MVAVTDREMARLLRWYPEAWRRRYGQELAALLEDTYGGCTPPLRCRLELARAGTVERCWMFGLTGSTASPAEGVRAGSLVVLWAWALVVVACAEFANIAEGWRKAIPSAERTLPTGGYLVVLGAAVCSAGVVLAGAAVCAGPLMRFVRDDDGWPTIKRHVIRSAALTVAALILFVVMRIWSGHLTADQRDGGDLPYGLIAIALAIVCAGSVISWTAAGTAAACRINLDVCLARRAGVMAILLASTMLVLTAGSVLWWVAIATRAPWFLAGTPAGTRGAVAPPLLVVACAVMALAALVAAAGARRAMICRSRLT